MHNEKKLCATSLPKNDIIVESVQFNDTMALYKLYIEWSGARVSNRSDTISNIHKRYGQ